MENQREQHTVLAEAVHRFERRLEGFNFGDYWDLREIMEALPHVKMKEGYSLDGYYAGDWRNATMKMYACATDSLDEYDPAVPEVRTRWFDAAKRKATPSPVPFRDGQVIVGTIPYSASKTVPPLEKYLDIDFTPEAIWEAMLLVVEACSYLPHRWHGSYARGVLVVDVESLAECCEGKVDRAIWSPFLEDSRLIPSVTMLSENEARIHYCRWGEWSGLYCIDILAARDGRSLAFGAPEQHALIEYDCGIVL